MQINNKNLIKEKIKETIQYFSIFKYPLLLEEIYRYTSIKVSKNEVLESLNELIKVNELYKSNNFYSNLENIDDLIISRKKMNINADKLLKQSVFYSSLLSYFPFVRGIAISGSLSKQCASEKSDIDFFVLIKENRLWISKTLIQLFKNVLRLFGKEEFLCTNYFKAIDNISLEEKSKFTEMELITMIPVYKKKTLIQFFNSNQWAFEKYPNLYFKFENYYYSKQFFLFTFIKKITEFIINLFGDSLDSFLMEKTKNRWTNAHLESFNSFEEFDRSIKIRKNEIKYHLNSSKSASKARKI